MAASRTYWVPSSPTATAYHEAGHVLMYEAHAIRILRASIRPTEHAQGYVTVRDDHGAALLAGTLRATKLLRRAVAVSRIRALLAGYEAEKIHGGLRIGLLFRGDPDHVESVNLARAAFPVKEPGALRLVMRERPWVRRYLRAHWNHVAAVARRLLTRKRISGAEARRVLAAVGPVQEIRYDIGRVKGGQ